MRPALAIVLWALAWPAAGASVPSPPSAQAAIHQAQVEARAPFAPRAAPGSDGRTHLAYELRLTSFQSEDDPIRLTRVAVFAGEDSTPLTIFEGAALASLLSGGKNDDARGAPLASGKSRTLFFWLTLPPGAPPASLRHQLTFQTSKGAIQRADDVRTPVDAAAPVRIGPPLRGGRWLAVEGPGNHLSHHWGGAVAIDGRLTIPQRYAIDWFGVDDAGHAFRGGPAALPDTKVQDWIGYGRDVLAVADGVVEDVRDGIPDQRPLAPQETPDDLTARTLYGNFVVLKIGQGAYAHYAHMRTGSLTVKVGQPVRRGQVIGRLGLTGAAGAPHLHFHISDRPRFEQSEGLPFVIDAFTLLGHGKIEDTLDPSRTADLLTPPASPRHEDMPLDGDLVAFP
jgi:murein DD-endopeptidase MepM/ murein hydrolase activator NlpD